MLEASSDNEQVPLANGEGEGCVEITIAGSPEACEGCVTLELQARPCNSAVFVLLCTLCLVCVQRSPHIPLLGFSNMEFHAQRTVSASHIGTIHRCSSNLSDGFSSCCAIIQERTESRGVFQVENVYADNATCGFLNCSRGEFYGFACQLLPRHWFDRDTPVLRTMADAQAVGGPLSVPSVFPSPEALSPEKQLTKLTAPDHQLVQEMAQKQLNAQDLASLDQLRAKAEAENLQAQCAGYITAAITQLSAAALHSNSWKRYCVKAKTAKEQARCARTVSCTFEDFSLAAYYSTSAAGICGQPEKRDACGESITNLIFTSFALARQGSQVDYHHYGSMFAAGNFLGYLGGTIPQFTGDIADATRHCVPTDVPEPGASKANMGRCVGYVLASATYIAAAALEIVGDEDDYYDHDLFASGSTAANSLVLAGNQALYASQYCGGGEQRCGEDITKLVASLFAVLSAISTAVEVGKVNHGPRWVAASASTYASEMAKQGSAAGVDCRDDTTWANNARCGKAVSGVLGSFSLLINAISGAVYSCDRDSDGFDEYMCAVRSETFSGVALTMSDYMGSAVLYCPFAPPMGDGTPESQNGYLSNKIPVGVRMKYYQT